MRRQRIKRLRGFVRSTLLKEAKMQKRINALLIVFLLATTLLTPGVARAQEESDPMTYCKEGAFSTEEDFVMREGEPFDGDPYISDGDVLSIDGHVCARNAELLARFFPDQRYIADLGLDALDILNFADRIIAFSTELEDPRGAF